MLFEKIQLEPGEEVLKVTRKHWFVIVAELFSILIMLSLPFLLLFLVALFPNIINTVDTNITNLTALVTFGVAGWSVVSIMAGFMIWTHYYLDLWIITDRRIIVVDQIHFFNRNVSIFRLERLQDMKFDVKGIIPTLLNFGTVKAQTAGAHANHFKTTGLPDPRGLQSIIQKATDKRLAILHNSPYISE